MTSPADRSLPDSVVDILGSLWVPTAEAHRVRAALNECSWAETAAAVERAGYPVYAVDLPLAVSGYAMRIEDTPCIVVNRAKSPAHQQYTIVHELAHHVLHLNPARPPDPSGWATPGRAELQAHLFAASWVLAAAEGAERDEVLRQNREASACLVMSLVMTAGVLVGALLIHLLARPRVPAVPAPARP